MLGGQRAPLVEGLLCSTAMDPTALVRESTARVAQCATHVSIDSSAVERLAVKLVWKWLLLTTKYVIIIVS